MRAARGEPPGGALPLTRLAGLSQGRMIAARFGGAAVSRSEVSR